MALSGLWRSKPSASLLQFWDGEPKHDGSNKRMIWKSFKETVDRHISECVALNTWYGNKKNTRGDIWQASWLATLKHHFTSVALNPDGLLTLCRETKVKAGRGWFPLWEQGDRLWTVVVRMSYRGIVYRESEERQTSDNQVAALSFRCWCYELRCVNAVDSGGLKVGPYGAQVLVTVSPQMFAVHEHLAVKM